MRGLCRAARALPCACTRTAPPGARYRERAHQDVALARNRQLWLRRSELCRIALRHAGHRRAVKPATRGLHLWQRRNTCRIPLQCCRQLRLYCQQAAVHTHLLKAHSQGRACVKRTGCPAYCSKPCRSSCFQWSRPARWLL
eukprot:361014-Chlamydomonas_euryale.AAC.9